MARGKKQPQAKKPAVLSSQEFSRKYRAAGKSADEQLKRLFEQVLSDWDRDDASTRAHLCGLYDSFAFAVGALSGAMSRLGVDEGYILEAGHAMSHDGYHRTDLLKTFRKRRSTRPVANVISLPVVHHRR